MFYILFRPPQKDSEKGSKSSSNGKTPKNYIRRVMKMDPEEKENLQKELWEKQKEQILSQMSAKPEIKKLGRQEKQFLRFQLYAVPFGLLAAYGTVKAIEQFNPGAPFALHVIAILILFVLYTMALGGIALFIYSIIFQPWVFTRIPEDKLPPLDDSEENQEH